MKGIQKTFFVAAILSFFFCVNVGAEPFLESMDISRKDISPFRSPTKRFLGKHSYSKIYNTLSEQDIYLKHKTFYDRVIMQEERGFMGYHASSHQFRVFQDIVRFTLEEVLELEFKKDFYFFRLPGDPSINNHLNSSDFLNKYRPVNDNEAEQRNQLISTNFSLFNNFDQKYECTAVFFEKALSFKPPSFEKKIGELFDFLGMSKEKIPELLQIGKMIENPSAGTLFQFFDFSHQEPHQKNAYEFIDRVAFPSKKKGEPISYNTTLSDLFLSNYNTQFLDQYRIVVNHYDFLNPYSSVWMRRYDLNDRQVVKEYEKKLRAEISKIPSDRNKAQHYKETLLQYFFSAR